jgi:protease-4
LGGAAAQEPKTKPSKKIAVFRLRGLLTEAPRGMAWSLATDARGTLRGLLERLKKAAEDDNVAAAVVVLDQPILGWAQVQEIRAALKRLREAGKEIHCHLEEAGPGAYMVAAACNRVSIVPSGMLLLPGLAAEALYFKGLLDKLGIVADMQHCGAYKGAAEPLTRTEPSKEVREQMNRLLGDLYGQMVQLIAESRRLRPDEVRGLIDQAMLTARQAAAANLVDELSYRHEFIARVRKRFDGAELAKRYGRKTSPDLDFTSPFALFKLFGEMMKSGTKKGKNVIGLVYVDGVISTGRNTQTLFGEVIIGSTTLQGVLVNAAKDKNVKAIVLRVDSPGGSAVASDIICQATQVVRKAGKPVIVSMGNIAASGGYYVSTAADAIFAEPGTLTGSIGVVGGKLALGGLFDMIGITTHTYKYGRHADMFNMTRPFDEDERKVIVALMNDVYEQFKRRVVDGRGERLKGDIDELAGGRLYTGRQALAKGLVDQLGGLPESIQFAASKAKLTDYKIRIMPKPKTLIDYINEAFGMEDEEEDISLRARPDLLQWLKADPTLAGVIPAARRLAPEYLGCLVRMLWRIELLRREPVLTVVPDEWVIR